MALTTARSVAVQAIVDRITDQVTDFDLVKAYDGHPSFARMPEIYAEACNGRFPSALVISEGRSSVDAGDRSLILRHTVSVFVATRDFKGSDGRESPAIYDLCDGVIDALQGYSPGGNSGICFQFVDDKRLTRSDFLAVYQSRWETFERGR